jgi:hypothetical protein
LKTDRQPRVIRTRNQTRNQTQHQKRILSVATYSLPVGLLCAMLMSCSKPI